MVRRRPDFTSRLCRLCQCFRRSYPHSGTLYASTLRYYHSHAEILSCFLISKCGDCWSIKCQLLAHPVFGIYQWSYINISHQLWVYLGDAIPWSPCRPILQPAMNNQKRFSKGCSLSTENGKYVTLTLGKICHHIFFITDRHKILGFWMDGELSLPQHHQPSAKVGFYLHRRFTGCQLQTPRISAESSFDTSWK